MIREFKYIKEIDIDEMSAVVLQMRELLEKLAENVIPDTEYSIKDISSFCKTLVTGQRNNMNKIRKGSWSVAPDERMPGDARVDFVFFPTYIAVSILSKFLQSYPHEVDAIVGYKEALLSGMRFCLHRGLRGHGYDATKEMIDAINVLGMGDVPQLLAADKAFCPELYLLLRDKKYNVDTALKRGNVIDGWGENYKKGYQKVSKILDPVITDGSVLLDDFAEIITPCYPVR